MSNQEKASAESEDRSKQTVYNYAMQYIKLYEGAESKIEVNPHKFYDLAKAYINAISLLEGGGYSSIKND